MQELNNNPLTLNNRVWQLQNNDNLQIAAANSTGFLVAACTAPFLISLDGQHYAEVFQNFAFDCPPGEVIKTLWLQNLSGSANTIQLIWGRGRFSSGITSSNITNTRFGQSSASFGNNQNRVTCSANNYTTLRAGDGSTRQCVRISNDIENLSAVFVGTSSVSAISGTILEPGDSEIFWANYTIGAYNPSDYPVIIHVDPQFF